MTAPTIGRERAHPALTRNTTYRVVTPRGTISGEYLGIEVPHGDRSILLRDAAVTRSIALGDIVSIDPVI